MSEARILVVDDDLSTRMIVAEALLASGFDVIEAEDGVAGLAMFEEHHPDAILLDINMPNLDGYDVCTQIRQLYGDGDVPIMVMTASDDLEAVERAFAAGATDFTTKPVNLQLLPYRIRYMLRSAHAGDVAREIARRLVQSQALARLVHWHVHTDGGFEWANDPMPTLCPSCPSVEAPPSLVELVHADDRARVTELLAARTAHVAEFRIVLPDGTERVMLQHATAGDSALGIALFGATQDITERHRAEQQVAKLAYYDDLTGIPNRRLIERYLEVADDAPRFAIVVDLGTASCQLEDKARDRLVRSAVARIIDRVRGNDLGQRLDAVPRSVEAYGSTIVGRSGPDELVVVSSGTDPTRLVRAIEGSAAIPFTINETSLRLSIRIGTAACPDPIARSTELLTAARWALQQAEGMVGVYSTALHRQRAREAAIEQSLDLALACATPESIDAITVRYEARVDPKTDRVIGRRAHPVFDRAVRNEIGPLLASDRIRAARVMLWTLTRALAEASTWPAQLRLTAALSCSQLGAIGGLRMIENALADSRFEPSRLDLELVDLPESAPEFEAVVTAFTLLKQRGIGIGLRVDDRTPLQALSRLPLTFVRLDPSSLSPGLLPVVISVAETLGLSVAVTGVNTPAGRDNLMSLEVAELSGAHVDGPVGVTAPTLDTCLQAGAAAQ
jgi:CheY-like chemotaxis protein/GGDEF domain-containing protein/EAL domain-containing protein (putative c-di-GMP-specific phosphodiesterase class I)